MDSKDSTRITDSLNQITDSRITDTHNVNYMYFTIYSTEIIMLV